MASDIETMPGPVTATPELATRILCRALRLVDFVQQNARLSDTISKKPEIGMYL
jgi:hypothetical protein